MPALSVTAARHAVERGDIDPVYYVTGDEEILKDELVDLLIHEALDPSSRDFNLDVRAAADLTAESLHTLVETPPMLAERRVAVVRNLEQWRKNSKPWQTLGSYLQRPSPTTTLVLVHGAGQPADDALARHATHVAADPPDAKGLLEWVRSRATRLGMTLEDAAAGHLVASCGGNLSHVAMEMDKLAAAALGAGPVSVDTVALYVGVRRGETPADWVGAVLARDIPRAVDLLDIVLQQSGVTGVSLLNSLGTALVGTRLAAALREAGQAERQIVGSVTDTLRRQRVRTAGRWGDDARLWAAAAAKWSAAELDTAIAAAHRADGLLKGSTVSDARATLYNLLLSCSARKEPS